MNEFIIYTLIAWTANSCFVFLLFTSLGEGQWLGKLLKWDDRLVKWGNDNSPLYEIGGGCPLCFCHFVTQVLFWVYLFFITQSCDYFPGSGNGFWSVLVYIIWYISYVSIGTTISLRVLKKMGEK